MSRSLTLEPTYVEGRASPWRLFVPAYLSETGKGRSLFFKTQAQAKTAANALKVRTQNFGRSLVELSPARMGEAAQVFDELDRNFPGVTLIEVYRVYAGQQRERTASVSFEKAFDEFLALPKRRNAKYRKALTHLREKYSFLADQQICDIKPEQLAKVLNALPPSSRNAQMRVLRAIFNLGIRRGWLVRNPIAALDFAQIDRREVEIFEPEAVEKMLNYALASDLTLLPWLVFGTFCGLRPDGELAKLEWRDVHLADSQIVVRPEVSKTRRRRFVDIASNALTWINAYIAKGGSTEGKVLKYERENLRNHRRSAQGAAGLVAWIQQGMRHSFCSYWLAKHKDVNELVLMSGHDDPDTMWENYHRGTTEADAERFWKIVPAEQPANLIAFKKS
jgi:integrase